MTPSDDTGRWAVHDEHAPAIRAYVARRVERDAVDDVVAHTFAIAWGRLPRGADPLPWLYAVAGRAFMATCAAPRAVARCSGRC